MNYIIGLIGMWLLGGDAIPSIVMYLNAPSYNGSPKQTWGRDHSIRIIRGICGLVLIWIGWRLR